MLVARTRVLLPAVWLGLLLAVAGLATPVPFWVLERAEAVRVAARVLALEGTLSLLAGAAVLVLERLRARRLAQAGRGSQFSLGMVLALAALACTVLGYHVIQPMIQAARHGQGALGVPTLHLISVALFGLKALLVATLAWRAAGDLSAGPSS